MSVFVDKGFRGSSRAAFALCRCVGLVLMVALGIGVGVPGSAAEIDFSHDIVPVLRQHCGNCHTGGERQGGLSLNTRASVLSGGDGGPAAVAGKSGDSELIARVTADDAGLRMPPEGEPLPADKIELLRRWIDAGLPWEPGFSFAASGYEPPLLPRRPELPPAVDGRTNPVDRIVDAYLAERGIEPRATVDDAAFLRRVSLDLVGLLPTPEQLAEFLADERADKRQRRIDALLADEVAYAEHWLTFWNDLLRNDYSGTGFITGGRKQVTDWLVRSLTENKPYDRMVRELIAPSPESEGFIQGIRWRGDVSASQTPEVQFAQNVAQAFLGINMKCASCHNSFIDRWTLDETYGLAAIYATGPLEIHRCDKPTGRQARAAWIFPELGEVRAEAPQAERLGQLAELMTHPENGRLTRTIVNRIWHRLLGRGIVHPVDAMHTPPWSADLLDFLAVHLADEGYDLKQTIRLVCNSYAYQAAVPPRDGSPDLDEPEFRGPVARRMTAEQFLDAVWQITAAGPAKPDVKITRAADDSDAAAPMVRASLMKNDAFMTALGRPTRDQIVSTRPSDLTALEAIYLSNGQQFADTVARGAAREHQRIAEGNVAADEVIARLFAFALARTPTDDESTAARDLLGDRPAAQDIEDLLWAVFMLPEFHLVR
ncbi:MAG: DUF1549 domain-containing protein [Pirellulaceae bacterium]|nr:DUF1549 domain-containing protein [Pirellulaceae bacterium]